MSAMGRYVRAVLERAESEARADASATVEAHHLLLAMAALEGGGAAGEVLDSFGLDHATLRAALEREFDHSLTVAGVSVAGPRPPRSSAVRRPALGVSARLALRRGFTSRAGRRGTPVHLLLGIVRAEAGTVPRTLALAGINRAELLAATLHALDAAYPAGTG